MRLLLSKLQIAVGFILVVLCAAHLSWCQWSLPRHGTASPHGIETGLCNWGTSLLDIAAAAIAVLTIASGLIGLRVRSRTLPWYAAQIPAMVAWGWLGYSLVYSMFIYGG